MNTVEAIVACTPDGVIGYGDTMPWRHSGDLKRFKELTTGKTIVIGYRTLLGIAKSMDKPRNLLPGRQLVVMCRTPLGEEITPENEAIAAKALIDKINYDTMAKVEPSMLKVKFQSGDPQADLNSIESLDPLIICGGAATYERYLPFVTKLYLTIITGAQMPDSDLVWLLPNSMNLVLGNQSPSFETYGEIDENGVVARFLVSK